MSKNDNKVAEFTLDYFNQLKSVLDTLPLDKLEEIINVLMKAYQDEKTIYVMGNGGSAANASHIVNDISKGTVNEGKKRIRIVSLCDNIPLILAYANDCGYENIFVEQLKNLLQEGDVVIAISGSGNSPNILKAVEYATSIKAITIGLTGYDGGKLNKTADISLIVPSFSMQRVEDVHLIIGHIFMCYFNSVYGTSCSYKC